MEDLGGSAGDDAAAGDKAVGEGGQSAVAGVETPVKAERNMRFLPQDMEASEVNLIQSQADAPACFSCGSIMVRNGACYKCLNCGATSGCS